METSSEKKAAVRGNRPNYSTLTPLLSVHDVPKLLDFLKRAFGAREKSRFTSEDGTVMHAEVEIGNSILMLGEVRKGDIPITSGFYMYVDNADNVFDQALKAGAESLMQPSNQFYGDRGGAVRD